MRWASGKYEGCERLCLPKEQPAFADKAIRPQPAVGMGGLDTFQLTWTPASGPSAVSTIVPMNGLIALLEDRLSHVPVGALRCSLLAELALARAQAGDLERAEADMRSLRVESESSRLPRFAIFAMICDGVIDYYRNLSPSSYDRIFRASILARAASDNELIALSQVWLAHAAFNFQRWDALDSSLHALDHQIDFLSSQAAARLALTIADIAQYCGNSDSAESWYQRARSLSRVARDHGLLVAIESNRILLKLDRLRVQRAFGSAVAGGSILTMRTELHSLRSIHEGFGSESMVELLLWAEATEHEFSGRYVEAVRALGLLKERGLAGRSAVSLDLVDFELRIFEILSGLGPSDFDFQRSIESMGDDDALIAIGFLRIFAETPGIPAVDSEAVAKFDIVRARCENDLGRLMSISAKYDDMISQFDGRIKVEMRSAYGRPN